MIHKTITFFHRESWAGREGRLAEELFQDWQKENTNIEIIGVYPIVIPHPSPITRVRTDAGIFVHYKKDV